MTIYPSALVAIALDENPSALLEKALQLAARDSIHLAHVEEHPVTGFGDLTGKNHNSNEQHIRQTVFPQLQKIASEHGIPGHHLHIVFGDPAAEIITLARQLDSRLIIAGCHGKHGLGFLRSSVLKDMVQNTHTDILSIYTGKTR